METATVSPVLDSYRRSISWRAVIAGAVVAAAVALVLHAFAAAIGLAVSSTSPTWRDSSLALVLLSGVYLLAAAGLAYGAGGYVAGRLHVSDPALTEDETEFRDGVHGLAAWALATLVTAFLAWGVAQTATQLAAPSGGDAGPAVSVGGENIVAYDLDRLLRSDQERPADFEYARAEAGRILLTASSHDGVTDEDRAYLARLTARQTGLSEDDATTRVQEALASADENIAAARRGSVLLAFMAGAAAVLGAAIGWFSAVSAGKHRSDPVSMRLGMRGPVRPQRLVSR